MKKLTTTHLNYLKKIVDTEFGIDIASPSRKIIYTNARLVFYFIARKYGGSYSKIGEFLGKNHATVIHVIKKAPWLLAQEKDLELSYLRCKNLFESTNHPVLDYSLTDLRMAYLELESAYDELKKSTKQLHD